MFGRDIFLISSYVHFSRADSDILLGSRCGLQTLMVGSGCHTLDNVEKWRQSDDPKHHKLIPDYYAECLGELYEAISRHLPSAKT